jgi:hypothetical protein
MQAAKMQEQEVGDGSNLVVTFAGELLAKAEVRRVAVGASRLCAPHAAQHAGLFVQRSPRLHLPRLPPFLPPRAGAAEAGRAPCGNRRR